MRIVERSSVLTVLTSAILGYLTSANTVHRNHENRTVNTTVGQTTVLPCSATNPPVIWRRILKWTPQEPTPVNEIVIDNGHIINGFNPRFSLDATAQGEQNLVIQNTEQSDVGTYECRGDGGQGSKHIVVLQISESQTEAKLDRLKAEIVTAEPGARVSLPCRVSYKTNTQWRNEEAIIYNYGQMQRNFTDRFAIGNTEDSHNALVISYSIKSDSGIYECIEDNGKGRAYHVFLSISGKEREKASDENAARLSNTQFAFVIVAIGIPVGMIIIILATVIACLILKKRAVKSRGQLPRQGTATELLGLLHDTIISARREISRRKKNAALGPEKLNFLLTAASVDEGICYFCELNDIFYFVKRSGVITAYKLKDEETDKVFLEPQFETQLIGTFSPSGFTASKANNCIYLGDRSKHCVLCIEAPGDDRMDWKIEGFINMTKDNEKPQSLSATQDGRLVVLVSIENSFSRTWHGRLDIYRKRNTSDSQETTVEAGVLQTSVHLPKYAENPWCVTYSGENTYIITYGVFKFGILKLNAQGHVKARCTDGLDMPRSIKHVAGTDFVYVLDSGKHKLLKFDLELKKQGVLFEWQFSDDENIDENKDDHQPVRITFSMNMAYAMVGMQSGRVDIYKLSGGSFPSASVTKGALSKSTNV